MTFEPYKSPGSDSVYLILLQKGLDILLHPIVKIMKANIALRYTPEAWKSTRDVFIPKPRRNGYIKAKDFRPISFSSIILKTMERLVDRYLKENSIHLHFLESSQYAYREGRSTNTALHHLVGQVETQLEAKDYALRVFLDIEGAFDSTSNKIICETTERYQIPEAIRD